MNNSVKESMTKKNYNGIDMFKVICAILVVTIHFAPFGKYDIVIIRFFNFFIQKYIARIAVPFFFITSGFFFYKKTTIDKLDFSYEKKYIMKLLRLYVIWTIIYFPLVVMEYLKGGKGLVHSMFRYFRNIVFTGSYFHLWYFPALIFAIVLVTYLLKKKIYPKKIVIFASIFYFFGLFAQSWFGFITPIKHELPYIWNILLLLKKIIVTTRNGLFEAFLFVSIGMLIAFYKPKNNKKKTFICFIISMILLFIEIFLLEKFNFIKEYDMYLLLPAAAIFMFLYVLKINTKGKQVVYAKFRLLSSLLFYIHPLIGKIVRNMLKIIFKPLIKTPLVFVFTLVFSIIISLLIIKLSQKEKYKWLRLLY